MEGSRLHKKVQATNRVAQVFTAADDSAARDSPYSVVTLSVAFGSTNE